jgi:hypothetical protein
MRQWLLRRLPAGLIVHPAEWFLAVLCFQAGLVIVSGLSRPTSVSTLLWPPIYVAWGICLSSGSIALMVGLSSIRWAPGTDLYTVKRIPAYKLGLRLLGLSSFAYAIGIGFLGHWNNVLSVALSLAFAGMCGVRLLSLGRGR